MDTILALAITGVVAFGLGILLGMSWQHKRDSAHIAELEASCQSLADMLTSPDGDELDWQEDAFDMDEQMMQTGSHQ